MGNEQARRTFLGDLASDKAKREAVEDRKKEVADAAAVLHADLFTIMRPYLPQLPEPEELSGEELMQKLSKMTIEDLMGPVSRIMSNRHIVKSEIESQEVQASITLTIDGDYTLRDPYIEVKVEGIGEKFVVSNADITVESVQRQLPPGVEPVYGGHDQTVPVYTRLVTNEDLEKLEDLVTRLKGESVKFEYDSYPLHY